MVLIKAEKHQGLAWDTILYCSIEPSRSRDELTIAFSKILDQIEKMAKLRNWKKQIAVFCKSRNWTTNNDQWESIGIFELQLIDGKIFLSSEARHDIMEIIEREQNFYN